MAKTIVLYGSKYGTTKQYAEWIAQALDADISATENFAPAKFDEYDTIIVGGGLYAGKVCGLDRIVKASERIRNKKLIVFTVGTANPEIEKNVASIRSGIEKTLPKELFDNARIFHLRGGIDYERLSFVHMCMMRMLKVMIKRQKAPLDEEQQQLLREFGKSSNFVDRKTIAPIIESLGVAFVE